MKTSQILANSIEYVCSITGVELGVSDSKGNLLAQSKGFRDEVAFNTGDFLEMATDIWQNNDCMYFKIKNDGIAEYILKVCGDGDTRAIGLLAVYQIESVLYTHKKDICKKEFYRDLLRDSILAVDINRWAKKLGIDISVRRMVMVVEAHSFRKAKTSAARNDDEYTRTLLGNVLSAGHSSGGLYHVIETYMNSNSSSFVTTIDEGHVTIIKELYSSDEEAEIEESTVSLYEYLENEGFSDIYVSYGTVANEIKEVSRSYREAKITMEAGKIFFDEKRIIAYNQLGIGRLIYQLPLSLCKLFLGEILDNVSLDDFSHEILSTIERFFANSLNVSEAARQLFIHRNTLLYRLDKVEKITRLDLRVFEDAVIFHTSVMIMKYIKYMETHEV
ncbi:MAG: helix-turn-helix domain-containing protein [Lachnospiraceae bacterium]|jgi:carbohydrate diacid regulator|nr:helix-turn-helix domain-containing protein [Lachnospiraceae bacterium]